MWLRPETVRGRCSGQRWSQPVYNRAAGYGISFAIRHRRSNRQGGEAQRERTRQTFVGEWLRTGDRYHRDRDGFYWYEGRIGDVFKVSGQWVSPLEVESCLLEHPAVLEVAVVGAHDEAGLLKPRAFVVARGGTSVTASELQAHVRARLLPHKYPRWVVFVDELPKTASGKVQRFQLRSMTAGE